jgi:ABC-type branched-subunit amino acid transport system substrate-binding protein
MPEVRNRSRSHRRRVTAATVGSLVLVASACGSSSDAESSGSGRSADGELSLDDPVTIGLLWEVEGESAYGIDAYNQGAELAVAEINAAGGVGGHPVETFRIPASPVDPQNTVAAMVEAQSRNPTAIIGLASPTQVAAASGNLARSPIPVVATTTASREYVYGADAGAENLWISGVYDPSLATEAVDYMAEELGLQDIGLMGTNESYGSGGLEVAEDTLAEHDLEPFAVEQFEPDATDVTQQVLAMEGADGVIDWSYPGPLGVQLKQFRQNGLDIPTMSSTSGLTLLGQGTVTPEDTEQLYLALPCDTNNPSYSEGLQGFSERFRAENGDASISGPPAPWAYDAVKAIVAAVELAGSNDPEAVNEAMADIEVTDGSGCGGPLVPDDAHVLTHEVVITRASADGTSEVQATVQTDPVPEGG